MDEIGGREDGGEIGRMIWGGGIFITCCLKLTFTLHYSMKLSAHLVTLLTKPLSIPLFLSVCQYIILMSNCLLSQPLSQSLTLTQIHIHKKLNTHKLYHSFSLKRAGTDILLLLTISFSFFCYIYVYVYVYTQRSPILSSLHPHISPPQQYSSSVMRDMSMQMCRYGRDIVVTTL